MKKKHLIILSIVLTLALALSLLSSGYRDWNVKCWFGHNYADGVCVRCGADKPAEEEPNALVAELYQVSASAMLLNAGNDGVMPLAAGNTIIVKGVETQATVTSTDITKYTVNNDRNSDIVINGARPTSQNVTLDGKGSFKIACAYENYDGGDYGVIENIYYRQVGSNNWYMVRNISAETQGNVHVWQYSITTRGNYELCVVQENWYDDDSSTYNRSDIYTVQYGQESAVPPAPTKTGYTFTGWYTDEACTNKYTAATVTDDITLYAGFRAHTYSIKFNANSGSGTMSNLSMTYDQNKNLTDNAFTKDHFAFKGWATSANGSIVYSDKQSVKNLTADDGATVELFAVWERSEVSVSFVVDGSTTTTWIAIGTKATLPATPTKAGHNFIAWLYDDGTIYDEQTISEDTTLTAYFEIIQCTVTFIVDGEVYATYICDWGTSLGDVLNANNVNPLLMSVEDEYSRNF